MGPKIVESRGKQENQPEVAVSAEKEKMEQEHDRKGEIVYKGNNTASEHFKTEYAIKHKSRFEVNNLYQILYINMWRLKKKLERNES